MELTHRIAEGRVILLLYNLCNKREPIKSEWLRLKDCTTHAPVRN